MDDPQNSKQILSQSLPILQKLIPDVFSNQNDLDFSHYLQLIITLIYKSLTVSQPNKIKQKSFFIKSLLAKLIRNSNNNTITYIKKLIHIVTPKIQKFSQLLVQILDYDKKYLLGNIQADIKSYFFRQSQNLVDQSASIISVQLQDFFNFFNKKYKQQTNSVLTVSKNLLQIKQEKIKTNNKQISKTFLTYFKNQLFFKSCTLNCNFAKYNHPLLDVFLNILQSKLNFQRDNQDDYKVILSQLSNIFYYYPLIMPYCLFYPIKQMDLLQFLLNTIKTSTNKNIINQTISFLCYTILDHGIIIQNQGQSLFLSQFIGFRIIKFLLQTQLSLKQEINNSLILLILQLSQIKRFVQLINIKMSQQQMSLRQKLTQILSISQRHGHYQTFGYLAINRILFINNQMSIIQNTKQIYSIKKQKQQKSKLLNQCVIPFNILYRDSRFKRQQNIIKLQTNDIIIPLKQKYLKQIFYQIDKQYNQLTKYISNQQKEIINIDFQLNSLNRYFYHSQSMKFNIRVKNKNQQFGNSYQLLNNLKTLKRLLQSRSNENNFDQFQRFNRRGLTHEQFRIRMMMIEGNRNNRPRRRNPNRQRRNRYAPQDVRVQDHVEQQKNEQKQLLKTFQKSLQKMNSTQFNNIIESGYCLQQSQSLENLDQQNIKEKIQKLQFNYKVLKQNGFETNIIELQQYLHLNSQQKQEKINTKLLQSDFDIKRLLQPEKFQQFLDMNQNKIRQTLDYTRIRYLDQYQNKVYSIGLQRTDSSDSSGPVIDALQYNHTYFNMRRTLSRKTSLSSQQFVDQQQKKEIISPQPLIFSQNIYINISQHQIQLSLCYLYYQSDEKDYFVRSLLQNTKIQNKLLNTLLYLYQNPFCLQNLPKKFYKLNNKQNKWQQNKEGYANFKQRILTCIIYVKNLSYCQNQRFLFEDIGFQGFFNINILKNEQESAHIPYKQILLMLFKNKMIVQAKSILKKIDTLPDQLISMIIAKISVFNQTTNRHGRRQMNQFYQSLQLLCKNQKFKKQIRQKFSIQKQNLPCIQFMAAIIKSQIFTKQQLLKYAQYLLASWSKYQHNSNKALFINKLIQILSDQQIQNLQIFKNKKDIFLSVLKQLRRKQLKISKQPINRIFNFNTLFDLTMKQQSFFDNFRQKYPDTRYMFQFGMGQSISIKKKKGFFKSQQNVRVYQSSFIQLKNKSDEFWRNFSCIRYINTNGQQQRSSGSGVFTNWFSEVTLQMIQKQSALFVQFFDQESKSLLFINPSCPNMQKYQHLRFIGKLMAKALINQRCYIYPSLSSIIYKSLLKQKITYQDIKYIPFIKSFQSNIEHAKKINYWNDLGNFQIIKQQIISKQKYSILDPKISSFQNNISVSIELQSSYELDLKQMRNRALIARQRHQLIQNGSNIEITKQNINQYIQKINEKFYDIYVNSIKDEINALVQGFLQIVPRNFINIFSHTQLKDLIQGQKKININDLKKHVLIHQPFSIDHPNIKLLFECLEQQPQQQKSKFIHCWISSPKISIDGFRVLNLTIGQQNRYPGIHTHTCGKSLTLTSNILTKVEMKEKIRMLIYQGLLSPYRQMLG